MKTMVEIVMETAAAMGDEGKFYGDRVYISELYKALGLKVKLETFKGWLVEWNRERSISLARADMVEAMDPAKVAASETKYLCAEFHFVCLPSRW